MAGNRTFTVTVRINADGTTQATQNVKKTETAFSKLGKSLKSLTPGFLGIAAAVTAVTAALVNGVREVFAYEKEVRRLESAFDDLDGVNVSGALRQQAEALSVLTGATDTAVLSAQALIAQFGATPEQTQRLTQAAAEASAALGIGLNEAAARVAKTLGGYAGELGEVIPELKALSSAELQAGGAADVLLAKFEGTAEATRTAATAFTNVKNALSDFVRGSVSGVAQASSLAKAMDDLAIALRDSAQFIPNVTRALGSLGDEFDETTPQAKAFFDILFDVSGRDPLLLFLGKLAEELNSYGQALADVEALENDVAEGRKRIAKRRLDELAAETDAIFKASEAQDKAREAQEFWNDALVVSERVLRRTVPVIEEIEEATTEEAEATQEAAAATESFVAAQTKLAQVLPTTTRELEKQTAATQANTEGLGGRPLFPGLSGATYTYTTRRSVPTENGGVRFVQNFATRRFGV